MKFPKKGSERFSDAEIDAIEVWKKDLSQTPQGRKIIDNFEKDPHVPDHICEKFFKNLAFRIKEGYNSFDAVSYSITDDMLLQGPRIEPKCHGETFFTLVKMRDLLKNFLKPGIPIFKDQHEQEQIAKWINGGVITIERHFKDKKLRGARPIAWATYAEAIDKEFNINDNIDDLCDRLGLMDFNRCDWVVELRYDKNKIENPRIPSVIDAALNPTFCPSDEGDPYGYNWDLKSNREGFPEIVHEPVDIKKIDSIRCLGHKTRDASVLFSFDLSTGETE